MKLNYVNEAKLSLSTDNVISYIENFKESIKRQLELKLIQQSFRVKD